MSAIVLKSYFKLVWPQFIKSAVVSVHDSNHPFGQLQLMVLRFRSYKN